jgi:hypothetical protein
VTDHPADVHALRERIERLEILAVGLPLPRHAREDALGRDVLDRLHEVRKVRREYHPAVAHHDGRNAVPARPSHRIPEDLRVEMCVDVEKRGMAT